MLRTVSQPAVRRFVLKATKEGEYLERMDFLVDAGSRTRSVADHSPQPSQPLVTRAAQHVTFAIVGPLN